MGDFALGQLSYFEKNSYLIKLTYRLQIIACLRTRSYYVPIYCFVLLLQVAAVQQGLWAL